MPDPHKPLTPTEQAAIDGIAQQIAAMLDIRVSVDETAVHVYNSDGSYKGSIRLMDLQQPDLT